MSRTPYNLRGAQRFPGPDSSGLPVEQLTLRYALNLLPFVPPQQEFLEMLVSCAGQSAVIAALVDAVSPLAPDAEIDSLLKAVDAGDLALALHRFMWRKDAARIEAAVRTRLEGCIHGALGAGGRNKAYVQRVKHCCDMLGLSANDFAVIELAAVYQAHGSFEPFCDTFPYSDWPVLFASALRLAPHEIRTRIARNGTLVSKGLLKSGGKNIAASDAVFEYLAGLANDVFTDDDFAKLPPSEYALESFPVAGTDRGILLETLKHPAPVHLFFYGRPGTGKTELAKALAAESGRPAFLVKYRDDGDEQDRRAAMTATLRTASPDAVVIVDEADRLLNTATLFHATRVDKGWINHFMDECKHKMIWIANESDCIETSVLRRFSYSLEFKKFTVAQRESVWRTQLKGRALAKTIRPAMVARLAREYETDAGGIASALKAAENIFTGRTPGPKEAGETLGRLLAHHEKLSGIELKKKNLNRISPNYDASALNTDFPPEHLLSALHMREQNMKNGHHPFSSNILFWGLPGTGKTEFAKYIAQKLGKELLVKRMSDLQSMWVGQTEKHIAAAFDEADREGAVLFLDEADSLILDRKTASRSWESSQTNEVLTRMENFKGICICCTNLLDNLDEAALRRFTWKIKFLPLTPAGAEKLFRGYFQPKGRLSNAVKEGLKELRNLTPGDFNVVFQRQMGEPLSPAAAVAALKTEVSYKRGGVGHPIGFR